METVKIAKKGTQGNQGNQGNKSLSFLVRFGQHESLLNSLKEEARINKRSVNKQVLWFLENQLERNNGANSGGHL